MSNTSRRWTKAALIAGVTTLMLAACAAVGVVSSSAADPPAPIASEALTLRSVFTDDINMKLRLKEDQGKTTVVEVDDPSRTVVVRYTVQPGAQFPWHSHAGPVFVNLISGASNVTVTVGGTPILTGGNFEAIGPYTGTGTGNQEFKVTVPGSTGALLDTVYGIGNTDYTYVTSGTPGAGSR